MINIKDPEILHKIIEFQSCIIEGRNIKGLLRQNIDFFLEKSQVDKGEVAAQGQDRDPT